MHKTLRLAIYALCVLVATTAAHAQIVPQYKNNPLTYPNGAKPQIDYANPAATNLRFVSAMGTTGPIVLYSLRDHQLPPTIVGTNTAFLVDSRLGPTVAPPGNGTTVGLGWNVVPFPLDTSITTAAFVEMSSVTGASLTVTFSNGGVSGTGYALVWNVGNNNKFGVYGGGVTNAVNSPAIVVNVPYFIAASNGPGGQSIVTVRLDTGQIFSSTSTTSGAGNVTPACQGTTGCYYYASDTGAVNGRMRVGPVMFSGTYLTLQQLLQWAQNPWSFWFANRFNIGSQLVGKLNSGARRLMLMGVGN